MPRPVLRTSSLGEYDQIKARIQASGRTLSGFYWVARSWLIPAIRNERRFIAVLNGEPARPDEIEAVHEAFNAIEVRPRDLLDKLEKSKRLKKEDLEVLRAPYQEA